jgi:hypothetical protein
MLSRRGFLKEMSVAAGTGFFVRNPFDRSMGIAPARQKPGPIWSVDAGEVRVSRGPWTVLPAVETGVHIEDLYLRMPDGVRLNAFLYLPADLSRHQKIPGVLNTTPYRNMPRKDSNFARNGYASLFVDVRGSGGSEGIPKDEYAPQEHQDTAAVIDWLSRQPWSNGHIGMYGTSYSAFNSVWVAAAIKPPALKAIFVRAGTDIRYTDDIHFPGGAMLMVDNSWAIGMFHSNVMPGAPDFDINSTPSLDRWETTPWLLGFLHHQLDGPYWRHGSLAPDYGRLTTPTFLAGGYLDIYQNFVPRIMKNSRGAVTMGILGPWHHSMNVPGPVLDWDVLQLRWFDQWLKGKDSGILREPRASFYIPRWTRQSFRYAGEIPGEWRYLNDWPETAFSPQDRLYLRPDPERPVTEALALEPAPGQGGKLADSSGPASALKLRYYPATGGSGQSFGPTGHEGYYGLDHRGEDVWGLVFDTSPLRESIEILGFAKARLFVAGTAPVANWIVRLMDVAPDGTSYLISRGYLNGTHRLSHEKPEALVPGEVYEIVVELMCTAYTFEHDHRIRVVVTNADFPVLWPSPYMMTTTLFMGGDRPSHIELPILPRLAYLSGKLPVLSESISKMSDVQPQEQTADRVSAYERTTDVASGTHTSFFTLGDDKIWCRVKGDDPAAASLELSGFTKSEGNDRRIEVRAEGALRSTEDEFILDVTCTLLENDQVIKSRQWKDRVRRELV